MVNLQELFCLINSIPHDSSFEHDKPALNNCDIPDKSRHTNRHNVTTIHDLMQSNIPITGCSCKHRAQLDIVSFHIPHALEVKLQDVSQRHRPISERVKKKLSYATLHNV